MIFGYKENDTTWVKTKPVKYVEVQKLVFGGPLDLVLSIIALFHAISKDQSISFYFLHQFFQLDQV